VAGAVPLASSPVEGMFVLIPIAGCSIADCFHFAPTLNAPSDKRQRMMNLPLGFDEVEIDRLDQLKDKLEFPLRCGQLVKEGLLVVVWADVAQT
jgi:hypothetical protein